MNESAYSKRCDFIKSFKNRILELGVDPNFVQSPAFDSVLSRIEWLCDLGDIITISQKENKITILCSQQNNQFDKIVISCGKDNITCIGDGIRIKGEGFSKGGVITTRLVHEVEARFDKNKGSIVLKYNKCGLDDSCERGCNRRVESVLDYYDKDGISIVQKIKSGENERLAGSIRGENRISDILYPAHVAFPEYGDGYATPWSLDDFNYAWDYTATFRRLNIDMATASIRSKTAGKFNSQVTLHQEYDNLTEMNPVGAFSWRVNIKPLSEEAKAILREKIEKNNPASREGLIRLALPRFNGYSYNSDDDKEFVCSSENPRKKSR